MLESHLAELFDQALARARSALEGLVPMDEALPDTSLSHRAPMPKLTLPQLLPYLSAAAREIFEMEGQTPDGVLEHLCLDENLRRQLTGLEWRWPAETAMGPFTMTWLLNIARWLAAYGGPEFSSTIEPLHLGLACLFGRGLPPGSHCLYYLGLGLERLDSAQNSYFQKLIEKHPNQPFLRAVFALQDLPATFIWKHLLWHIEKCPESPVLRDCRAWGMNVPAQDWLRVLSCWQQKLEEQSDNLHRLANAAHQLSHSEPELAFHLLAAGSRLERSNPTWLLQMASLIRAHEPAKALPFYEAALERADADLYPLILVDVMTCAFACDENARATACARKLLDVDQPDGQALHFANLILGRLALKNGELDRAEDFLLASGRTPGYCTLNSFGPNMSLAHQLLTRGRQSVVLKYFELCRKFWPDPRLDEWIRSVRAGDVPHFGPNMIYGLT